jgi:Sigma-70 region 2
MTAGRSRSVHCSSSDGHRRPSLPARGGTPVSALTRIFGVHNLALAEDVVQDAFCRALEVWGMRGVPDNPSAWLMTTARNRALDVLRRQRTARNFAPELGNRRRVNRCLSWTGSARARWRSAPVPRRLPRRPASTCSKPRVTCRRGRARTASPRSFSTPRRARRSRNAWTRRGRARFSHAC